MFFYQHFGRPFYKAAFNNLSSPDAPKALGLVTLPEAAK